MSNILKTFDSTILKPTATDDDIKILCKDAIKYGFCSVCVNPARVANAKKYLEESTNEYVKVCSVVDFPFGSGGSKTKAAQAIQCIDDGADELDVVFNVGAYLSSEDGKKLSFDEIKKFNSAAKCKKGDVITKVIIETCFLNDDQIYEVSKTLADIGVDFVKTSTGYGSRGASINDIKIIKKACHGKAKIKASGGIGTLKFVKELLDAGASRIGTSHAVEIANEMEK